MRDRGALGRGDRDDPEQHGQVPVAVPVERGPGPARQRHRGQRPLGTLVVAAAEVEPPEPGAQRQPERRHNDERTVDGEVRRAEADRDDRLPDRNQHDEPVPLDEVRRRDREAAFARAPDLRRQPFEQERERPEDVLRRAAERAADHDHERGREVERRERQDRPRG